MKNGGDFWFRYLLVIVLVACGDAGQKNVQSIKPVTSFFQFRANVSGLDGKLVLANQGRNEIAIQQNGLITFPQTWTQGGQYEIKVMEEPCSQRCSVDEPTGQIATSGAKTISISCSPKTWDYPLIASNSVSLPNTDSESPSVAMNKYGDMFLAWYQNNYYNLETYNRMYENRKWSQLPSMTGHFSFAGYDVSHQSITFNDLNEGALFWEQMDGTQRKLFMGDYEDGNLKTPTNFSNIINVANEPASQYHPIIKSNALGEKIAVWSQVVSGNIRLYKAEFRNGSWTLPTNIIDNINPDGTDVSYMDAAINDVGDILIAWQQSDGTYERIYKSEYHHGIWTHPTGLTDEVSKSGTDAYDPKVAINNAGDAYIVWYQEDGTSGTNIRYQVFVAEYHQGTWVQPSSLSDNISPNDKHSKYPTVVVNDVGQAEIASLYRVNDSVNVYQVAIQQKNPNTAWSSPMILSTTNSINNPTRPQIGMDQQGNILVAWALQNTGDVYKAEYRNGTWTLASLSKPVNFNSSTYDYPSVAVNNCRATLAWSQKNDAGVSQIYVAQYH